MYIGTYPLFVGSNMLAGDSFLLLFVAFWFGITHGPFWLFGVAFLLCGILNRVHSQIIVHQRIQFLENAAKKSGMPLPPHIQEQINEEKKRKGFSIWRSPLE